jgi:8-oxo-dGTP diphosphatase
VTDQLDIVRAFYRAINGGDPEAVASYYAPDCIVEHVFTADDGVYEGGAVVAEQWRQELGTRAGILAGHTRVEVSRIAGMETGWGWVLAEWIAGTRDASRNADDFFAGYSHFWIEHGLIRRHRSVARRVEAAPARGARPSSDRRYPSRPIIGIGAVIIDPTGKVVLVKRRNEPLAGQWSLPGGTLDLGETLEAGVAREVLEETGLIVDVGPLVEVFDRILLAETGRVHYHFVLIDFVCTPRGGTLVAGSDVTEVALADPADLAPYRLTEKARDVIMNAVTRCATPSA